MDIIRVTYDDLLFLNPNDAIDIVVGFETAASGSTTYTSCGIFATSNVPFVSFEQFY